MEVFQEVLPRGEDSERGAINFFPAPTSQKFLLMAREWNLKIIFLG